MKKRLFVKIMAFCMAVSLSSCGDAGSNSESAVSSSEKTAETSAETETPTEEQSETPAETSDETPTEEPTEEPPEAPTEAPAESKSEFNMGETWTVDGMWSVTVTGVTETADRNQFSDKTPSAVYIVDYSYTNIGYEDDFMDGLYISLDDTIVDSAGSMGYTYPNDVTNYPQETPVGATCNAQVCIGVDNPGAFKITVNKYDSNSDKQKATFVVQP